MNFNIILHRENTNGDWSDRNGKFQIHHFDSEGKQAFLEKWAEIDLESHHDDLCIIIDGIPYYEMIEEQWAVYCELEAEMKVIELELREEARIRAQKKIDEAAERALQMANQIARDQKAADLRQYNELKAKLGL